MPNYPTLLNITLSYKYQLFLFFLKEDINDIYTSITKFFNKFNLELKYFNWIKAFTVPGNRSFLNELTKIALFNVFLIL